MTREFFHFTATLTGYAYETVPNTALKAGQTSGNAASANPTPPLRDAGSLAADSSNTPQYKSLGELALGTASAPARRQP